MRNLKHILYENQLSLFGEDEAKKPKPRYVLREPKIDEEVNATIENIINILKDDDQIEVKEEIRKNTMRYGIEPVIKVIFGYAATTDHFMQVCKNVKSRLDNEYIKSGMIVIEQDRYGAKGSGHSMTSIESFKASKERVVKGIKLTIINRSK